MIDVHVLAHEDTKPEWLERCLRSLDGQPVNVHVVDNTGYPVGPGRAKGYALGAAEFVSYLDSDDVAMPGAYEAVLRGLRKHRAVVTLERVVNEPTGYVCPTLVRGHAVLGMRREDVEPLVAAMPYARWCVDVFTRESAAPVQLPTIGVTSYIRPGTARSRVTGQTYNAEKALWLTMTT